jgi:serine-type D-Ala-D-Ala endopeptidase (penicillin-binding protein 7)
MTQRQSIFFFTFLLFGLMASALAAYAPVAHAESRASAKNSPKKKSVGKAASGAPTNKTVKAKKSTTAIKSGKGSATKAAKRGHSKQAGLKRVKSAKLIEVADFAEDGTPNLLSQAVMVLDQTTGRPLFTKNADTAIPIASITKLMTSIIVLDSKANLNEPIVISEEDVDTIKNSRSRLPVGTAFRREDLMRLALMASENRAASALGRSYPGGVTAFVSAMNAKARQIGLHNTRFADPTGLSPANIASPQDLALLVAESAKYPQIREFSTTPELYVTLPATGKQMGYNNTNALIKSEGWNIGVSKTGFINEAGKCLVMQAVIANAPVIIVLMDSWGRLTRVGDANRIKKWIESGKVALQPNAAPANAPATTKTPIRTI